MKNNAIGFGMKMLGIFFIMGVLMWGAVELIGFRGLLLVLVLWFLGFSAGRMTCPRVIRGVKPKDLEE